MTIKIFISYRRQDNGALAGRVRDRLVSRYGDSSVFMDIEQIPFGRDFRTYVRDEIANSDVVIAIVGQQWNAKNDRGGNRFDEDTDPVRVEIETSLRQSKLIIPMIVAGARMPREDELPMSMREFVWLNAAPLDPGRDFSNHIGALTGLLDATAARADGTRAEERPLPAPQSTWGEFFNRLRLAPFGAVGSVVPYVIKLFNELDDLTLVFQWKYPIVLGLFGATAALVAAIFPYRHAAAWKAMAVGLCFTGGSGIAAALARHAPQGRWLGGGPETTASWLDYLALF